MVQIENIVLSGRNILTKVHTTFSLSTDFS